DLPAFGKELSEVSAVCQGDINSCVMNYAAASGEVAEIGMDIRGNVIDLRHPEGNCPFCVETELTNLFENNLKINKDSDYIVSSASTLKMPDTTETQKGEQKIIFPDNKDEIEAKNPPRQGAITYPTADEIAAKIREQTEKNVVSSTEEAKEKAKSDAKDNEVTETKETKVVKETIDIENHPLVKKLMETVTGLSNQVKSLSEDKAVKETKLTRLERERMADNIGNVLAKFEYNFHDPDTGKPAPEKFEEAFKFLAATDWTPEQIETIISKLSPFGSKSRKMEAAIVTNKASTNRGVPRYNAAFNAEMKDPPSDEEVEEDEENGTEGKKIISSASTHRKSFEKPVGIRLMERAVKGNNWD